MTITSSRTFSKFTDKTAQSYLDTLLSAKQTPDVYRDTMKSLGVILGSKAVELNWLDGPILVASTAEDADFLTKGILDSIKKSSKTALSAVFWNNHYQLPGNAGSVAPVIHKYLQPGYQTAKTLIIAKSVISGSCVVRTNLLALLESVDVESIIIISPVMHKNSQANLLNEFPKSISKKFKFLYFAIDAEKDELGEVKPGIGGQIYKLLGLGDQPVSTGFVPQIVRENFNSLTNV